MISEMENLSIYIYKLISFFLMNYLPVAFPGPTSSQIHGKQVLLRMQKLHPNWYSFEHVDQKNDASALHVALVSVNQVKWIVGMELAII